MKATVTKYIRIAFFLALVPLLSTCEFLFYYPAFMPAVSEVEVDTDGANWWENYNGDQTGSWSYSWTAGTGLLSGGYNSTNGSVPAMESLSFANQGWGGINEFLGMLYVNGVTFGGSALTQTSMFHGSIPITFDYYSTQPTEYSLPYAAIEGIGGSGPTTKLTGTDLTLVQFDIYNSGYSQLDGYAEMVFKGSGPAGLVYMVYYHNCGLTTMAYQKSGNPTSALPDAFPTGHFTYVINVFPSD